jgi:hypothetical protein
VLTDNPGDPGDTAERAAAFFRRGGYTIPLAWDGGGILEKSFALRGFPTVLLLDRDGHVRMRHVGFIGSEDLAKTIAEQVEKLAAEPRS